MNAVGTDRLHTEIDERGESIKSYYPMDPRQGMGPTDPVTGYRANWASATCSISSR